MGKITGIKPDELLLGVSMYLKEEYRAYYTGRINEERMEIRKPAK